MVGVLFPPQAVRSHYLPNPERVRINMLTSANSQGMGHPQPKEDMVRQEWPSQHESSSKELWKVQLAP